MTHLDTYINNLVEDTLKMVAKHYFLNQIHGKSMRDIAKASGCHPSTVMRHVHKIEECIKHPKVANLIDAMTVDDAHIDLSIQQELVNALKYLRQKKTVLAVASDMARAVIFGQSPDGGLHKLTTLAKEAAHVLVIRGDVRVLTTGRIVQYVHTNPDLSATWQAEMGERRSAGLSGVVPVRGETALETLGRRRGPDGAPFLSRALVMAGLRLNEDFVLSGCQTAIEENFEKVLIGHFDPADQAFDVDALRRFQHAIKDLGPGLADIAVRSCCLNEGIERSEAAMGWSARSGKIVLRIALQRLKHHYEVVFGAGGGQIG